MRDTLLLLRYALIVLAIPAVLFVAIAMVTQLYDPRSETIAVGFVSAETGEPESRELEMVTLLPRDAIPAIFDPSFVSAAEADERFFDADDIVIGVEIGGDARAYGVAHLSSHEIVNDVVGGTPIGVTW